MDSSTKLRSYFIDVCNDCEGETVVTVCPHGLTLCAGCTHHRLCSDESNIDWPTIEALRR